MNIDNIVKLWYKTQNGHIEECRKAQSKFYENDCCLHGNQLNSTCADCDDETYHEEQDNKAMEKQ